MLVPAVRRVKHLVAPVARRVVLFHVVVNVATDVVAAEFAPVVERRVGVVR